MLGTEDFSRPTALKQLKQQTITPRYATEATTPQIGDNVKHTDTKASQWSEQFR
jgi:hypothetical protein